jgi:predicted AAA+ superfamily ATPase
MQKPIDSKPFLPSMDLAKYDKDSKELSVIDIYKIIWDGSFPKLLTDPKRDRKSFYRSYLQTYIERDIKDFQGISNELKFYDFIRAVSARTANLLNYNELAKDVDIDVRTAKLWLSALERSGMVKLLEPYYANITKRIIKTPKIYFLDTGLCAYLTAWDSPESLMNGAMNGAILETYVFTEILKSYWHNGDEANIFFYRDTDQREIDFVIEKNMTLYPMDVKKTASPSKADMRAFKQLQKLNKKVGDGAVICLYPTPIPIDTNVLSFPVWEI